MSSPPGILFATGFVGGVLPMRSEVKSRGVMREGRACRGRTPRRPRRGTPPPGQMATTGGTQFSASVHIGAPPTGTTRRTGQPLLHAHGVHGMRFQCVIKSHPHQNRKSQKTLSPRKQILWAAKGTKLCGLCVLCGKITIFRCRIQRLRHGARRRVEGVRPQQVAPLPRDCSEVKSRGVMREGRASASCSSFRAEEPQAEDG